MRILLIHQYFLEKNEPGGSRFNEMAKVWVEEGHQVTVVSGLLYYLAGTIPDEYRGLKYHRSEYEPGLEVLRCYVSPEYNNSFRGRLWAYFSFVWYGTWGIIRKLKKNKFDVIIATSPPLFIGIIAWIASRVRRIPYVFEVRDLWPESAIDTGVLKNKIIINLSYWLEKFIYKGAFLINVLTPAFRDKLIQFKNVSPSRIIFVPNACDFSLSEPYFDSPEIAKLRSSLGWDNQFVITYVGAHGVANHLVQLLDAAERLTDRDIKIVLIGEGMKRKELIEEAKKRNLTNVEFLSSMPKRDVVKYILASDVGISVLKKVDTFKTIYSNKTFDYMSCRKPIIMVIDGISRELVEQAKCGVYAEPENIDDIVSKIDTLYNDRAMVRQMGQQGYDYAKNHFDRHVLARKYVTEIQNKLKVV